MENSFFNSTKDVDTNSVQEESQTLKITKCNIGRPYKSYSWIKLFPVLYNLDLYLQLDRNMNSPPIAHFRFSNIVLKKKVLLRECKRHTAHRVASAWVGIYLCRGYLPWDTPIMTWLGDTFLAVPPRLLTWPGEGVTYLGVFPPPCPDLAGGYLPWMGGNYLGWGVPTLGYPFPQCEQTDTCENSTFPSYYACTR